MLYGEFVTFSTRVGLALAILVQALIQKGMLLIGRVNVLHAGGLGFNGISREIFLSEKYFSGNCIEPKTQEPNMSAANQGQAY